MRYTDMTEEELKVLANKKRRMAALRSRQSQHRESYGTARITK